MTIEQLHAVWTGVCIVLTIVAYSAGRWGRE